MPDADALVLKALLAEAALEAAELALAHRRRGVKVWTKGHSSPVTEADIAVDKLLKARLTAARPDFGWLSEETADTPDRLSRRFVFVVDPIDGTRAYADGADDWTISLAVVLDGAPVAAALAEPEAGRVFLAAKGAGAELVFSGGRTRALVASDRDALAGARLAGPKPLTEPARREGAVVLPKIHSLALRFAKVACGEIDAAFASRDSHDWDLASADLILTEAGGLLTGLDGAAPRYNRETPTHPALVSAGKGLHGRLRGMG